MIEDNFNKQIFQSRETA